MLEPIVRVNNARNSGVATVGQIERKLPAQFVGKISVKECACPCPPALGDGNEDGVATGKLVGAAAEVPSHGRSTYSRNPGGRAVTGSSSFQTAVGEGCAILLCEIGPIGYIICHIFGGVLAST